MTTISELAAALDKEMSNVTTRRADLERKTIEVQTASEEYQKSLSRINELRNQINSELDNITSSPNAPGRIRVSS